MEIQRALVDRQFDRYVLSGEGVEKHEAALPAAVLQPLDAANTTRKAQWEARVHHNALVADPFRSDALDGSIAYFLDSDFQLMQVVWSKTSELQVEPIYTTLTKPQERKENASLCVAELGVLVVNDGNGVLRILKSGNPLAVGAPWAIVYEFEPLQAVGSLLINANYDEALQRFAIVLAEPLSGMDKEASYRLWVVDVLCATSSDSMDVDSGAIGLEHTAFEVGRASTLPDFASFNGSTLAMLVEGSCTLMIEAKTVVEESKPASAAISELLSDSANAPKRSHEESDLDMDIDDVLSKVPRAGIGYHGDVSDMKHPHELIDEADLTKPLAERFRKSSIPYSSLDEPLHSTSPEAVRSPKTQPLEGPLEVPTPDTILGGFEECDDIDPNAKAVLLLIDTKQQVVQDKLDVNCRSFRYLGKSSSRRGKAFDACLLFQNDVNGLVFDIDLGRPRLALRHMATFPAFGFVQASKQDKKYLTYDALARFAIIGEFEKRIFVYHGQPFTEQEKVTHVRRQNVLEIGDHQLMGMCTVGAALLLLSPHHIYHVDVATASS